MTDSPTPSGNGFFELDADGSGDDSYRTGELKRLLFDLVYLVMNADGTEHISERMLVEKLEQRLETEGSVDVEGRADELKPILEKGPPAIRDRVQDIADEVVEQAGDYAEPLTERYLDLLRGLIVADASVTPEEHILFEDLCERWNVDMELPN